MTNEPFPGLSPHHPATHGKCPIRMLSTITASHGTPRDVSNPFPWLVDVETNGIE